MSTFYTVPTADKSIASVKSTVLATGVSLLFMYLVRMHSFRFTMAFKASSHFSSTKKTKASTKSKENCWKHRECSIYSLSQVSLYSLSHHLNLPTFLLRTPLCNLKLDHSNNRDFAAHFLHRGQRMPWTISLVSDVLLISPVNSRLDNLSADCRLHLVESTNCPSGWVIKQISYFSDELWVDNLIVIIDESSGSQSTRTTLQISTTLQRFR